MQPDYQYAAPQQQQQYVQQYYQGQPVQYAQVSPQQVAQVAQVQQVYQQQQPVYFQQGGQVYQQVPVQVQVAGTGSQRSSLSHQQIIAAQQQIYQQQQQQQQQHVQQVQYVQPQQVVQQQQIQQGYDPQYQQQVVQQQQQAQQREQERIQRERQKAAAQAQVQQGVQGATGGGQAPQQPNQQPQQQKKKKRHKKRPAKKNRKVGRWYLGETLGKGGYSWVKKGYDRQDGRVVALKFTSKAKGNWSDSQSKQVQNEIEALRHIKHKHVLQLLAYNLNAKYPQKDGTVIPTVLLVLEYLPGGELFDILYYTHALKENIARTYFHQLMDGLSACHNAGICHRDIKPQNLLLDSHFALKIADFGLAKVFDKDEQNVMRTFYVGTRGYQAPEILDKQPYSFACDIFSCGVVLFILLAGYPPFEAATSKCRWYAPLAAGNAREFWKQHRGCGIPSPAKDLITRMLWKDNTKRITINGIKKHRWYNGEKLGSKQLIKELKTLHRKMEVERRNDATKQDQLHDSIKRALDIIEAHVYPTNVRPADEPFPTESELEDSKHDDPVPFYNGETIPKCRELLKTVFMSESKRLDVDCTGFIANQFWDMDAQELHCDNIASQLVSSLGTKNPIYGEINEADDAKLKIDFTTHEILCIAPLFPDKDVISFKDVFTQCQPKLTLYYIQAVIANLGGEASMELQECSIEARLATHNFPAPVVIAVRIYFSEQYDSHVVRFDRISGDVLHFARVLKKLISQCWYVLTGLTDEQYNAIEEKDKISDDNEDFLNDFDIDTNNANLGGMDDNNNAPPPLIVAE